MWLAKWISFFLLVFVISSASAEVYRCQLDGEQTPVFTDSPFKCVDEKAQRLSLKPQIVKIERKLLAAIPDLSQRDPLAHFPDDGRKYCAPVAVSNSLSTVMGGLGNTQQIELARTLGSADYMATDNLGTSPNQLLKGVERYLETHKNAQPSFKNGQLQYHGKRSVARKFNPGFDKQVELPWLVDGINKERHIWLNIGWYQTQRSGKQKRIGGHWVTLVGYEKRGSLKDSKGEYLIVNDPATRGNKSQEQLTIKVAKLNGRWGHQLINSASKPQKSDMAWIDGAIQLALD
jgi:hypothetical protein